MSRIVQRCTCVSSFALLTHTTCQSKFCRLKDQDLCLLPASSLCLDMHYKASSLCFVFGCRECFSLQALEYLSPIFDFRVRSRVVHAAAEHMVDSFGRNLKVCSKMLDFGRYSVSL